MTIITISLAFPHAALWQNKSAHRFALARQIKASRKEAWGAARSAGVASIKGHMRYRVLIEGYRPTGPGRPHDVCNLPATLKGHIDGLADALCVDDARFETDFPRVWAGTVKAGMIRMRVEPIQSVWVENTGTKH